MIKTVFQTIDALTEAYIGIWMEVCTLESPTDDKGGVDAVGRYFIRIAEEKGWQVELCPQETSGDVVCITMNPDSRGAMLCLSGHIDTVHPVGSFGTPTVRRDGEKLYGPGVTDCKGGVVSALLAMDALHRCGYTQRPVRLLLQTDEEVGSAYSKGDTIRYICEKAKDAAGFLNLETHTVGTTTMARKGSVSYRFDVTGAAGHSSRCVTEGANAIVDAAHKMLALDQLKDKDGITCNCALVSGGTRLNTVPDRCSFSVNCRFATQDQYHWLHNFVQDLANTAHVPDCSCQVTEVSLRPAMERSEKNDRLLEQANRVLSAAGLVELKPKWLMGGSDASFLTQAGIPCLDSLGTRGGRSHSLQEYAWLESLAEAAKRAAAIICGL